MRRHDHSTSVGGQHGAVEDSAMQTEASVESGAHPGNVQIMRQKVKRVCLFNCDNTCTRRETVTHHPLTSLLFLPHSLPLRPLSPPSSSPSLSLTHTGA
jgi:hypothetical protein